MLFTVIGTLNGVKVKRLASANDTEQASNSVVAQFNQIEFNSVLSGVVKTAPGKFLTK